MNTIERKFDVNLINPAQYTFNKLTIGVDVNRYTVDNFITDIRKQVLDQNKFVRDDIVHEYYRLATNNINILDQNIRRGLESEIITINDIIRGKVDEFWVAADGRIQLYNDNPVDTNYALLKAKIHFKLIA